MIGNQIIQDSNADPRRSHGLEDVDKQFAAPAYDSCRVEIVVIQRYPAEKQNDSKPQGQVGLAEIMPGQPEVMQSNQNCQAKCDGDEAQISQHQHFG